MKQLSSISLQFVVCVLLMSASVVSGQQLTSVDAAGWAYVRSYDETYLTARNAENADAVIETGAVRVGQETGYQVHRSLIHFPLTTLAGVSVSACTLFVDGVQDQSETNFSVFVYQADTSGPTYGVEDFSHFSGWESSGTYDPTVSYLMNVGWNTSGYSAGWNAITFASAGIATVQAALGDTLWIAMISSRDRNATTPTTYEFVEFENYPVPYLSIEYTTGWGGTVNGVPVSTINAVVPKSINLVE